MEAKRREKARTVTSLKNGHLCPFSFWRKLLRNRFPYPHSTRLLKLEGHEFMDAGQHAKQLNLAPLQKVAGSFGLKLSAVRDLAYHAVPRITKKGEAVPANGFASAFLKIGHRVYGDLDELQRLLEARRLAPRKQGAPASIPPPYPPTDRPIRKGPRKSAGARSKHTGAGPQALERKHHPS